MRRPSLKSSCLVLAGALALVPLSVQALPTQTPARFQIRNLAPGQGLEP